MGKKPFLGPLRVSFLSHFSAYNLHLAPFCLSISLPTRIFFKPNYSLLAPKTILFNGHFTLFSHVFHGSKRFCVYSYYGYLCFSSRIQQQIAPHLAAFYLAFSTKTHCIQHQNARHFAPKRTLFCTKTYSIQQQIAPKLVLMAVFLNKNSFCRIHMPTLFCLKTNLRENRFFSVECAIGR